MTKSDPLEGTFPLRAAVRLTGLSPELLRAWESRHAIVEPLRTPGGTRRYTAGQLERLRLVKAAVDAGQRIGQVARLGNEELKRRASNATSRADGRLDEILSALDRLEGAESGRLLSLQLAALGPMRFVRELATPLVHEIGERWAAGRMGVAQEHLASGLLRSLLGAALQPTASSLLGPRIVFATLPGERHELGLLMAALTTVGAGGNPLYLGAELPLDELLGAAGATGAAALALSLVTIPCDPATRALETLRSGLPDASRCWIGGAVAGGIRLPPGVEHIESLEDLEQRVLLLGMSGGPA